MPVLLTERDTDILIVTLNRPERMNALNGELIDALAAAWEEARNPVIRAVVVTGAGRGFCAGTDLRQSPGADARPGGLRSLQNPVILSLSTLDKPVLAAVNGPAAGAGLALALAADIRVASASARFVPAFAQVGVVPDSGASWFAVRALGYSAAFDWLTSGREMQAAKAFECGLVAKVVEPGELLAVAIARARELAAMPGRAIGLTKLLLNAALTNTLAEQLEAEAQLQLLAIAHPEREVARARMADRLASSPQPPG